MQLDAGLTVTDRVTLTRPLGKGSMGEVWVGHHATLDADVAVKFISDEVMAMHQDAAERFTVEAAAAARIKSPHVVTTFDHGLLEDGTPFIVMELLEGLTLQQKLDLDGPLDLTEVARVVRHVGLALDAAEEEGIVHRDIKPHNIFLVEQSSGDLFAKVVDFGSAKLGEVASEGERLTLPGMLVGTPHYISRDLIKSPAAIDRYVDLWALGVVAYKALTGELPFQGNGMGEIGKAILDGNLRKPSRLIDIDERIDRWFAQVFSHDRGDRPGSGAEMAAMLDAIVKKLRATRRPPPPSSGAERRWIVVAMAAIAVAAAALVVAARSRSRSPAPSPAPPVTTVPVTATAVSTASATPPRPSASASVAPPPDEGPRAPAALIAALAKARVVVPGGSFWMGCVSGDETCDDHEKPGREVKVSAFAIDKVEVSAARYLACVHAGVCSDDELGGYRLEGGPFIASPKCNHGHPKRATHPINCVDHADAERYCRWVGARLPSEAEWERAARGDDKRLYPWGSVDAACAMAVMNLGRPGCRARGTWPTGSKEAGASPYGVLNLAANVREWVADRYAADAHASAGDSDPTGPSEGVLRVTKGGSFGNGVARFVRISTREGVDPATRAIFLGFRCAADAEL